MNNLKEKITKLKELQSRLINSLDLELAEEIIRLEASIPGRVFSTKISDELISLKAVHKDRLSKKERLSKLDRAAIGFIRWKVCVPRWLNHNVDIRYAPTNSIYLKVIYASGIEINTAQFSTVNVNSQSYMSAVKRNQKLGVPTTINTKKSIVIVYGLADPLGNFYALIVTDEWGGEITLKTLKSENSGILTGFDLPKDRTCEDDHDIFIPTVNLRNV